MAYVPPITALGVCSFEQWSLLADGDFHKCSPGHLIGLKCPFKSNSLGAEIATAPISVDQQLNEIYEAFTCIGECYVKKGARHCKRSFYYSWKSRTRQSSVERVESKREK